MEQPLPVPLPIPLPLLATPEAPGTLHAPDVEALMQHLSATHMLVVQQLQASHAMMLGQLQASHSHALEQLQASHSYVLSQLRAAMGGSASLRELHEVPLSQSLDQLSLSHYLNPVPLPQNMHQVLLSQNQGKVRLSHAHIQAPPCHNDVQVQVLPSQNHVQIQAPPSHNHIQMQVRPSHNHVQVQLPPSHNHVRVLPSSNHVQVPLSQNQDQMPLTPNQIQMPLPRNHNQLPLSQNQVNWDQDQLPPPDGLSGSCIAPEPRDWACGLPTPVLECLIRCLGTDYCGPWRQVCKPWDLVFRGCITRLELPLYSNYYITDICSRRVWHGSGGWDPAATPTKDCVHPDISAIALRFPRVKTFQPHLQHILDSQQLAQINAFSALQHLDLCVQHFWVPPDVNWEEDAHLTAVGEITGLKSLSLPRAGSREDWPLLPYSPALSTLSELSANQYTLDEMSREQLEGMSGLVALKLQNCSLVEGTDGDDARWVTELNSLVGLRTFMVLDWQVHSPIPSISRLTNLECLELTGSRLADSHALQDVAHLLGLTKLVLQSVYDSCVHSTMEQFTGIPTSALTWLTRLTLLQHLELRRCGQCSKHVLKLIGSLPCLASFHLEAGSFHRSGEPLDAWDAPGMLPALKQLSLSDCRVFDRLAFLRNLTCLEVLHMTGKFNGHSLRHLSQVQTLKELRVDGHKAEGFVEVTVQHIAAITWLRCLKISNFLLGEAGWEALGDLQDLEELSLQVECDDKMRPEDVVHLTNMKRLKVLRINTLGAARADSCAQPLGRLTTLQRLHVSRFQGRCHTFADFLSELRDLSELNLSCDGVVDGKWLPRFENLTALTKVELGSFRCDGDLKMLAALPHIKCFQFLSMQTD